MYYQKKLALFGFIVLSGFLLYFGMIAEHNHIPLEILFGNPEKMSVRVAPNGLKIAYLKPDEHKRLQIWTADITGSQESQITQNTGGNITSFFWSYDSDYVMYDQDKDGNENWSLYRTNIYTKEAQHLTKFEGVQIRVLRYSRTYPDLIVLGINNESKQRHDPYLLNLVTGELQLLCKSPENALSLIINHQLEVIGALISQEDGSCELQLKKGDLWVSWLKRGYEDSLEPLFLSKDNRYLYALDDFKTNTASVVKIDLLHPDSVEIIASDDEYDATMVMYDINTYALQGVLFNKQREEWLILDDNIKADFAYLQKLHYGELNIVSRSNDDNIWIVAYNQDTGPIAYYVYDRGAKQANFLFYHRNNLLKYALQPMQPIEFQSRDGLKLHGYMTYPKNYQQEKVPLIVHVHGGPWMRDDWGYNSVVQWLANRGYAVLQINFRGSTGYGKAFLNAGNKQWGKKMLDDLVDGVHWAINTGYIDRDRVAIFGGSYGGYAALCGATFTQDVFKCAVDICGRSNLFSRFNAIPPYWKKFIAIQKHRIGDPDLEADILQAASPLFYADQIKIPLFIAHGTNDARINPEESEQIVKELIKNNVPHEFLVFPDEGHCFIKEVNRLKCFYAIEKFLQKYL